MSKLTLKEIAEKVIRANSIVSAVRVAEDHGESANTYQYALEQVEDMLSEAHDSLHSYADALETLS